MCVALPYSRQMKRWAVLETILGIQLYAQRPHLLLLCKYLLVLYTAQRCAVSLNFQIL